MVACYSRKLFQVKTITQNSGGTYTVIAVTSSGLDSQFFFNRPNQASSLDSNCGCFSALYNFFLSQYPCPHFSSECLSAQVQDKYPIIITK